MVGLYICAMLALAQDRPVEAVRPEVTRQAVTRQAVTRQAVTRQAVTRQAVTRQAATQQAAGKASGPRAMHEIHRDLRAALQEEAAATDAARRAASVARLSLIYGEIMRDPRLPDSPTLAGYRVKIRARLLSIQKDLRRDMERQGLSGVQIATSLGAEPWTMSLSLDGESAEQLAARLKAEAARWSAAQGGAALSDYGPLLVELIRQTISPEFWDVNGGPGVILYYRPGHALVIRATEDIHRQIGGAVGGLRK